ncbi:hypothetical protein KVT40_007534 [Elsinoe batatas]|uniref:F-box domain-containing protein n=1 Tax=Elsinoe batatas TaxID=2601811 RepID=A0A8K0PDC9_9PEZI|nr:hypothetical protein KVT40_007534 [Elsinoe batatas]
MTTGGDEVLLTVLPRELVEEILLYLRYTDLCKLSRASKCANQASMPLLWRSVRLTDKQPQLPGHAPGEHDDSDMIGILLTLANNPWVASLVHYLDYRCHITPHIQRNDGQGLSRECSIARSLSADIRTIHLVKLAAANLSGLRNLSIFHGHHYVIQALIGTLFGKASSSRRTIKSLRLEECSMSFDPTDYHINLDFSGLEEVDVRSVSLGNAEPESRWKVMVKQGQQVKYNDKYSRTHECRIQDVQGELGEYMKIIEWRGTHMERRSLELVDDDEVSYFMLPRERPEAKRLLPATYSSQLARLQHLLSFAADKPWKEVQIDDFTWLYSMSECVQRSILLPIFHTAAASLKIISLDWDGIVMDRSLLSNHPLVQSSLEKLFGQFFQLDFPQLTTLINRFAALGDGVHLPDMFIFNTYDNREGDVSSLETLSSSFFDRHDRIEELVWPINQFFSGRDGATLTRTSQSTLTRLASKLRRLEVGMCFMRCSTSHDQFTDAITSIRHFTTLFAPHCTHLKSLSINGSLPSVFHRELLRAFRLCPLRSLSLSSPIYPGGFPPTWDEPTRSPLPPDGSPSWTEKWHLLRNGIFLDPSLSPSSLASLSLTDAPFNPLEEKLKPYVLQAESPHEPILSIIARFYAPTLEHLTLKGHVGSPLLSSPDLHLPFMQPLQHLHSLRTLTTSLSPPYDGEGGDDRPSTAGYWNSLLLSVERWDFIQGCNEDGEAEGGARHPFHELAEAVARGIGPWLSGEAKARRGGVRIEGRFFTDGVGVGVGVDVGCAFSGAAAKVRERGSGGVDVDGQTGHGGGGEQGEGRGEGETVMLGYEGLKDVEDREQTDRHIMGKRFASSAGTWDQHFWMTTFEGVGRPVRNRPRGAGVGG